MVQVQYWRSKLGKDYFIMKYALTVLLAILPALNLGCSKSSKNAEDARFSDKRVVLQESDNKLTLGDVAKHFSAVKFESAQQEFDLKKDFVEETLERFLLIKGAQEAGIQPKLDTAVVQRNLIQSYLDNTIVNKIKTTDSDVDVFFAKYGGEIELGIILVYDSTQADSLFRALKKGDDFEQVARQFSRERYSAEKGGNLGYRSYDKTGPDVRDIAFNLKIGEFSRPIHTKSDWEIIKVYDHIKNTKADLEKSREFYRGLTKQYQRKKAVREFANKIRSQVHYTINQPVINLLIQKADSIRNSGNYKPGLPNSAYLDPRSLSESDLNMYMAKFEGGGAKVGDYISYIRENYEPERAPDITNGVAMEEIMEGLTLPAAIIRKAINEGFDRSEVYLSGLDYLKGSYLYQKMKDKIYSTIDTLTEADIAKYYNEHQNDFFLPDQVRASAIAVKTKDEATALLNRIKGGAVIGQLAKSNSLDKQSALNNGDLGFFTVARYTAIFQACENLQKGQLGGPIEYENNWWIFMVTDKIKKTPKTLDQVRADITDSLGRKWRADAYKNWINKRKEQTHYTVDLDLIKNNLTMGQLTQTGKETK